MVKNNPKFVEEFLIPAKYDEDGVQVSSAIGRDGKEYPDPLPMSPPVGYNAPPDVMTLIRSMVRQERFNQELEAQGFENFDEADDFDIEDDPDAEFGPTDYEKLFYPTEEKPAEQGAPPAAVSSKPDVSGGKPSQAATQEVSADSGDKSEKGSLPV